jgi:hypothetical protein
MSGFAVIFRLITGMLLLVPAGRAVAEEDWQPRIECGSATPQGTRVYNGRRHQEIVSQVSGERISSLTGGSSRVAKRHALIKRSDCWVTFWSFDEDGQKTRMKRQTGSSREVEDYPPENRFRPVP